MRKHLVLCAVLAVAAAVPLEQNEPSSTWQRKIAQQVDAIVKTHQTPELEAGALVQEKASLDWNVGSGSAPMPDRPRPPQLQDTIANLRAVMDHIEMENVNAVANKDAMSSTYASKKALIQSMLAVPQQAVIARAEQRSLCDKEVHALVELDSMVAKSVERGQNISTLRREQAAHYTEMTSTIKRLTSKNVDTLSQIKTLLAAELQEEKTRNGGFHFDPVALRQQQPADMLQHASDLTESLLSLMTSKVRHHDEALDQIKQAFACPQCEIAASKLQNAAAVVKSDLDSAKQRCTSLAEAHRALDEADRERVLALKKDLEELETAEKVHDAAEKALQEARKQAQHVAEKMVGFYQNLKAPTN